MTAIQLTSTIVICPGLKHFGYQPFCYAQGMRPLIPIDIVLDQASAVVNQKLSDGQLASAGADHLIVFARTLSGFPVVIKIGEDAATDAYVLAQVADRPVPVPMVLASGNISYKDQSHSTTIMTRSPGIELANSADMGRWFRPLLDLMDEVHRVTSVDSAGPVSAILHRRPWRTWRAYLRDVLTGEEDGFDWESIAESPWVDEKILYAAILRLLEELKHLPEPEQYHLLHGDMNPYNVLVTDDGISGLIDWSYARFGDPLFDFARLRMNLFVRQSEELTAAYFAHLHLDTTQRRIEEFYFNFQLLEYLNWYTQSEDITRVREYVVLLDRLSH